MTHQVHWMDDSGEIRVQWFATEQEARDAVSNVSGVAMVTPLSGGAPSVFRDGQELHDTDATEALLKFGHRIEVGISRPEEADTNIDPDDTTASGWRAGSTAVWGWRVWKVKDGPTDWVGTHSTREGARAAAEEAQRNDPALAGLPIVDIGPSDIR